MAFQFKDLTVYKVTSDFVYDTSQITNRMGSKDYDLSDQLKRASLSIAANIAEGYGRWHVKDKNHFYRIAIGSATECAALLDAAFRQGLVPKDANIRLSDSLDQICKMLQSLIRSVNRRAPIRLRPRLRI